MNSPQPQDVERVALKPCPFCGGEAKRFTIGDDEPNNAGGDVISCTRCGASSHVEFGRKENLVSRWNTRAALASQSPLVSEEMVEAGVCEAMDWLPRYSEMPNADVPGLCRAIYTAMSQAGGRHG